MPDMPHVYEELTEEEWEAIFEEIQAERLAEELDMLMSEENRK